MFLCELGVDVDQVSVLCFDFRYCQTCMKCCTLLYFLATIIYEYSAIPKIVEYALVNVQFSCSERHDQGHFCTLKGHLIFVGPKK